jgi:hypothetical protein
MNDAQRIAWIDQSDAEVSANIRKFGTHIVYVSWDGGCSAPGCSGGDPSDGPPFGYTVGLFGLGHPELLIFGANAETTAGVLNELTERIRAGADLVPGELVTFAGWPHRIVVESVPNPGQIVFEANRFYLRPDEASVPVLQLTYVDREGRFPWEAGYAAPARQPRPGTFRA